MIAADKAGKTPQQFVAEIAAGRKPYLDGFHIGFDNWHSTDAPENHALAREIYLRAAQERADRRAHDRAVLRPGEGHVPARPLHQGRVPELRHQGPVRRQLRDLRRRLCAHRPEAPLLGADAAPSPSCARASTTSSGCPTRAASTTSRAGRRTASCKARWPTRSRSGSPRTKTARSSSATGTSAATRRTSASRSPTRRASTSTSGSTRRWATWRR